MTPYIKTSNHTILELLWYNCKHKWKRLVVEYRLGILKQTFQEIFPKINLHISLIPSVFAAYCIFDNLIKDKKKDDPKRLMRIIET
jgi:hypothetical protein